MRVNRSVVQGKTFGPIKRTLLAAGAAVNLVGFVGRGKVRDEFGGTSLADFTVTITTGASGYYEYTLTPALTAALSLGRYVYDIELYITGETEPIYDGDHGQFEVTREVST